MNSVRFTIQVQGGGDKPFFLGQIAHEQVISTGDAWMKIQHLLVIDEAFRVQEISGEQIGVYSNYPLPGEGGFSNRGAIPEMEYSGYRSIFENTGAGNGNDFHELVEYIGMIAELHPERCSVQVMEFFAERYSAVAS